MHVPGDAWILVLIIFVWTPPHFWALALYRRKDYENAGLPMLPNTHGEQYTRLHIFLYTVILFAVTMMPFISGMSGVSIWPSAVVLGADFPRLCVEDLSRVFRRARAQDLPLLDRLSVAAVRRAADRSL